MATTKITLPARLTVPALPGAACESGVAYFRETWGDGVEAARATVAQILEAGGPGIGYLIWFLDSTADDEECRPLHLAVRSIESYAGHTYRRLMASTLWPTRTAAVADALWCFALYLQRDRIMAAVDEFFALPDAPREVCGDRSAA